MRKSFYSLAIAMAMVTIVSCNKEKNPEEKFSPLTVEENKANIEDAGIDMVDEVSQLSNSEATVAFVELGTLLETSDPFDDDSETVTQKLPSVLKAVTELNEDPSATAGVFKTMKSAYELNEDPETIQEVWEMLLGTYDWNATAEDWDYTEGGDKVIFNFPSSETSTSNDASLTIHSYAGVVIATPLDDEYSGDLPTALNAELKIGETSVASYIFAAEYNSEGVPSKIASDLTISDFVFALDITNTTSEVSANYKLTHGETIILDLGAGAKGTFTEENVNANTHTTSRLDYEYNPTTQEYEEVTRYEEEVDFEEIVNSANAHFRIMNLAIKGEIDIKGIADKEQELYADDESEDFDYETADSLMVEEINKYLNLRLVYEDSNEILAKVEAYIKTETYGSNGEEYEDKNIDFRLIFGDDSRADAETYFGDGFSDFVDAVNDLIDDLNADFDLELDYVEI